MERVQPEPPRTEEPTQERVPPERDPARLPALIGEARATTMSSEALGVAGEINALLIAMRAPGNESAEAKAVLAALDVGTLEGLVDAQGRSCRAEAVETLLACGFPHALNVKPEELAHRDEHRDQSSTKGMLAFGVFVGAAIFGVLTYLGGIFTALMVMIAGGSIVGALSLMVLHNFDETKKPKP